jgi:hypothetical protein
MKRAIGLVVPGLATFAAWQLTLGLAEPTYSVRLVAVLVNVLIGIGVATGWWARGTGEALLGCASAVAGIAISCFADWSDDPTGLFMIGWIMVTGSACVTAFIVILGTFAIRQVARRSDLRAA